MARAVRWPMAVALIVALGGCAHPSFNNTTRDTRVRAVTFDQRFPLLKAYQECFLDDPSSNNSCDKTRSIRDYTFAHFDERSPNTSRIITQHDSIRTFQGAANLLPSYSQNPGIRTLDTFDFNSGQYYQQFVTFYRNGPDAAEHRLLVQLPRRTCPSQEKHTPPEPVADLWQPVKFVIVVEDRATIFVDMAATKQDCPGLRVKDVFGDIAAIPAGLVDQTYVVYTADAAQSHDGTVMATRVTRASCLAEAKTSANQKPADCMIQTAKAVLERDPVPNIVMDALTPVFACREHTSSTDWNVYTGMAARVPGKVSYSKRCSPAGK